MFLRIFIKASGFFFPNFELFFFAGPIMVPLAFVHLQAKWAEIQ